MYKHDRFGGRVPWDYTLKRAASVQELAGISSRKPSVEFPGSPRRIAAMPGGLLVLIQQPS
jgi:hypothetical protein